MDRVHSIRIVFPHDLDMFSFFGRFEQFIKTDSGLIRSFDTLLPRTSLQHADIPTPLVSFDTTTPAPIHTLRQKNLVFGFNLTRTDTVEIPVAYANSDILQLGSETIQCLPITQVDDALKGTSLSVNHCGINISPAHISAHIYEVFRAKLAQRTNLYAYPTGEEWPFIIPSTDDEFRMGIQNMSTDRNPKFEVVYAPYHEDPLIQIDIQTSLNRTDVESLFPAPYGLSLEGLEHVFRSVYIRTRWLGVILRLDIRFQSAEPDFGTWIVKNGARY